MPTFAEELQQTIDSYNRTPEQDAEQRSYLMQVPVGAVRGALGFAASPFNALSAIPGVRTVTEPIAKGIESLQPAPSGGWLEQASETATQSVLSMAGVTTGLGAAGLLPKTTGLVGGALRTAQLANQGRVAATVGGLYGAAQVTETRGQLEKYNEIWKAQGIEPLTPLQTYAISLVAGGIETVGETLGDKYLLRAFGSGSKEAGEAVKRSLLQRLLPKGLALMKDLAPEVATEIGQAAGETAAVRVGMGQERLGALEKVGAAPPTVLDASGQVIVPTILSAGLQAGAIKLATRQPMKPPGQETTTNSQQTPPPPAPPDPFAPLQRAADQAPYALPVGPGDTPSGSDIRTRLNDRPLPTQADLAGVRPPRTELSGVPILAGPEAAPASASGIWTPETLTQPPVANDLQGALAAGLQRRGEALPGISPGLQARRAIEGRGLPLPGDESGMRQPTPLGTALAPAGPAQAGPGEQLAPWQLNMQAPPDAQAPGDQGGEGGPPVPPTGPTPVEPPTGTPPVEPTTPVPPEAPVTETAPPPTTPPREPGEVPAAPAPALERQGHVSRVITPSNEVARAMGQRDIATRYAIVEADSLIHSMDRRYPPELQPRLERQPGTLDAATELQVTKIANVPDFLSLAESRQAGQGAPIVNTDGQSLSGTARIEGLKRMYAARGDAAQGYRQEVLASAERYGLDPQAATQMKQPVLVRVLSDTLTKEQQVQFADEANQRPNQAPGAVSNAVQDAKKLTPAVLRLMQANSEGEVDLRSAANQPFLRALLDEVMAPTDVGQFFVNGKLTNEGATRLRRAIFAKAYGNSPALERLAEDQNPDRKSVAQGMLAAAPAFARLQESIDSGEAYPRPLAPDITLAANKLVALAHEGKSVEKWLAEQANQTSMFDDQLTPLAKDLIAALDRPKFKRYPSKVADLFHMYIESVYAAGQPGGLFAQSDPPSAAELLRMARDRVEAGDAARQSLLFPSGPRENRGGEPPGGPRPPTPDGSGTIVPADTSTSPTGDPGLFGPRAPDAAAGTGTGTVPALTPTAPANAEPGTGAVPIVPRADAQASTAQGASAVSAAAPGEQQLAQPRRDVVDGRIQTLSGREILAPPAIRLGTVAQTRNDVRKVDRWLWEQGIQEASAKQDEFAKSQFEHLNPARLSPADKDSLNTYLFGEEAPTFDLPSGKLQVLPQGQAPGPQRDPFSTAPLQLAEAQKVFRGQDVTQDAATGTIHVKTTGGQRIEIAQVPRVGYQNSEVRIGYGRDLRAGEQVAGRIQEVEPGFFRIELGPNGNILTFLHESGHFFEDAGILTTPHLDALNAEARRQGLDANAENRANILAAELEKTLMQANTPLGRAVLAVRRFFDKMARLFGIDPSVGSVTRRIQSGDIFRQVIATGNTLPPVADGMTRLYRGETTQGPGVHPAWITESADYQASQQAAGRWWTDDPEVAAWYQNEAAPHGRVVYQDVPSAVADAAKLAQQTPDIQRYSLDRDREYFLPAEYKGRGTQMPEQYEIAPGDKRRAPQSKVVDEQGNLLPLYHGTAGAFADFDLERKGSAAGQMFDGFFFAEQHTVATRYAQQTKSYLAAPRLEGDLGRARSHLTSAEARQRAIAEQSTERDLSPTLRRELQSLDTYIKARQEDIAQLQAQLDAITSGPNVRPVYLDIRNPFDATEDYGYNLETAEEYPDYIDEPLRAAVDARFGLGAGDAALEELPEDPRQGDAYRVFATYGVDEQGRPIGVKGMTQVLQDLGYDGIFHIGERDGRVWVAFHPNQILPVFQPEARAPRFSVTTPEGEPAAATPQDAERPQGSTRGRPMPVGRGSDRRQMNLSLGDEQTPATAEPTGALRSSIQEVTPRRWLDTGEERATEWKKFEEYQNFVNLHTPETMALLKHALDEGRPLYRKEITPMARLDDNAQYWRDRWQQHPLELPRFAKLVHADRHAWTPTQAKALSAMAQDSFDLEYGLLHSGQHTQAQFDEFIERYVAMDNVAAAAAQAASTFGLGLRSLQEKPKSTMYVELIQKLNAMATTVPAGDLATLKAEGEAAIAANDFYRFEAVTESITNPTLKEIWKELYVNSLLSSPSTWGANVVSTNMYMLFHSSVITPVQGMFDYAFSRITGKAQENFVQSGLPALGEFMRGFPQQFKEAWWLTSTTEKAKALAESIPAWQKTGGAFDTTERPMREYLARAAYGTKELTFVRKLAPYFTWAGRAMNAMDTAMRGLALDMTMATVVRNESLALGLDPPTNRSQVSAWERDRIAQHMADPVTGKPSAVFVEALAQANRNIFRDKPSEFVMGLNRLGHKNAGVDIISFLMFPFKFTPDRLLARGFELLPLNPYYLLPWSKKAYTGEWRGWLPVINPEALTPADAQMFAKQAVGMVMTGILFGMWKDGLITGSAPDDPLERENFYRQGNVPNSVKVGDTSLSWRRLEPLSLPLGLATTAFSAIDRLWKKQAREGTTPDAFYEDTAAFASVAAMAMTNFVLDSSYFAGMAAFFAGTQRGREAGDIPSGVLRQMATTLTPLVGLQRSLIRAADAAGLTEGSVPGTEMIRQPKGLWDTMRGTGLPWSLGGLSEPRLDVYGRGQGRDTSVPGELTGMLPVARGHAQGGKREQEFETLRYFPAPMPRKDPLGITYADDVYRRLALARGPWLLDQHDAAVESPTWDRLTPENKLKKLRAITSEANRRARRQVLGPQAARAAAD